MPEQLDKVGSYLCNAISNGIANSENYPRAYIKANGALVIECTEHQSEFQAFAEIFPVLCDQYKLDKLSSEGGNYWSKEVVTLDSQEICTFTFNIAPEQMDNLLLAESESYQGYRNAHGAGSILLLANPLLKAYKEGVICAFPVLAMDEHQVMLRIAGCNASELISTQLTYFITQYLPPEAYKHTAKRYGHWGSEIVDCLMTNNEALVNDAIQCCSDTQKFFYQQSMHGLDVLSLRQESVEWLKSIDETNKTVFKLLGVVSETELEQLKSLEIPIDIYLQKLLATIQDWLKEYEPGGERAPGGRYYYPGNEASDKLYADKLRINFTNINLLLDNISKATHSTDVSSKAPLPGFFKANDGKLDAVASSAQPPEHLPPAPK
jgi:hypothetical protein